MTASAYFALVSQTYIENWPLALCQLSIPQVGIRLSHEEVRAFLQPAPQRGTYLAAEQKYVLMTLGQRIEEKLTLFPDGGFVRLGSHAVRKILYLPIVAVCGYTRVRMPS